MAELPEGILDLAHTLADLGGSAALPYFRQPELTADNKAEAGAFDPVTAADRAAETAMRAAIARARPDDTIIGEEFGTKEGTSGWTWTLDPVDGTRAFVAGIPVWGVLIAFGDANGPLLGVIDQPHIGERFVGAPGGAEFRHRGGVAPMTTRAPRPLGEATLLSTFPEIGSEADRACFARVATASRLVRYGLDCYGYGLLALGQVDLVIEAGLNAYDYAAPKAVIEAAGGIVTGWDGGPIGPEGRVIAAANPRVHAEALTLLQG